MARRRRTRGYPVARLVGLGKGRAYVWDLYSQSVRKSSEIHGSTPYRLYQSIVEALRPAVAQGVTSILVATPDEKEYYGFVEHLEKHHGWLLRNGSPSRIALAHVSRAATSPEQVRDLVKSGEFEKNLQAVLEDDQLSIVSLIDKRLSSPTGADSLLFSLDEAENAVYYGVKDVEYVLVTEGFRNTNRAGIDRLLQIAGNKRIKTRIIRKGTVAESRISQFGGLLCILRDSVL